MTVRPRYTIRRKAQHLAAVADFTAQTIRPALELAIDTARIILTTHYTDPPKRFMRIAATAGTAHWCPHCHRETETTVYAYPHDRPDLAAPIGQFCQHCAQETP